MGVGVREVGVVQGAAEAGGEESKQWVRCRTFLEPLRDAAIMQAAWEQRKGVGSLLKRVNPFHRFMHTIPCTDGIGVR